MKRTKFTDEKRDRVRKEYATADCLKTLAAEIGISIHTLKVFASNNGLRRPHRGWRVTKEQERQICAAYQAGCPARFLSEKFPLSHQGILNVLARNGIEVRSRSKGAAGFFYEGAFAASVPPTESA